MYYCIKVLVRFLMALLSSTRSIIIKLQITYNRFGGRWRVAIKSRTSAIRVVYSRFVFSLQDNTTANTNTITRRSDVCSKAFACVSWTARCTPKNVLSPWCPWRRRSKKTDSWCRTHTWNWRFCTKPKGTWIKQRIIWRRQSMIKSI